MDLKTLIYGFLHKSNLKRLLLIPILLIGFGIDFHAHAAGPSETMQACVKKLQSAKSLKSSFTASISGRNVNGTLLSKGKKFSIVMPGLGTWYDGRSMWSYNSSNGETAVWIPSPYELAESNPLLYLSSANDYNVKAGTGAKKGESVVVLTPKKRNTGVKSVTVVINTTTNLPKRITVNTGKSSSSITLNSVTLNPAIADSQFTYPKSKYPKVNVVDLR